MLWFARDLPNLVSLAGLVSALLGIYFAILGVFPAAMIGLVWAVVFDWLDGRVARGMKDRTDEQRAVRRAARLADRRRELRRRARGAAAVRGRLRGRGSCPGPSSFSPRRSSG